MPPKSRVEEKTFERALRLLQIDDLRLLNTSTTGADVWRRLCLAMDKADNVENRRACFDAWNKNRYNSHDVVSSIFREAEQAANIGLVQPGTSKAGATGDGPTMPTTFTIPISSIQPDDISRPPDDPSINQHERFIDRLKRFLAENNQNISIIDTHDLNSGSCSGAITSIQVVCNCAASSSDLHNPKKPSFDSRPSTDDNSEHPIQSRPTDDIRSPRPESTADNRYSTEAHNILTLSYPVDDENGKTGAASPVQAGPPLIMSPVSSASPSTTSKSVISEASPMQASKPNIAVRVYDRVKNLFSSEKAVDRANVNADQEDTLLFLQRRKNNDSCFTVKNEELRKIAKSKQVIVSQVHMETLKKAKETENGKKKKKGGARRKDATDDPDANMSTELPKRDFEWIVILNSYIKQTNDYCAFAYERHHFTHRNTIGDGELLFLSADAHCQFDGCPCQFHAIIQDNAELKVDYSGDVIHKLDEVHARPCRGSQREELQKFTLLGSTPSAVRLHQLKLMSPANKEAGNRDIAGSSPSVIRKIASEANVKLRRDKDIVESLHQLKIEQEKKIFPAEQVPGYLQQISTEPLRLVCFTAGGLAAYHKFAPNMPLSWDATGGIVVSRTKKIFYYELTMSNIIKGGPPLPIAVMISASHGTMDIIHWMNCFKEKYKRVYGFAKEFPNPPVIHSDRATVFLLAGISVFNHQDTMERYLERCWRIVNRKASKLDLEITVVHACLGHFMKNVKFNASKELTKKQVPFGMWLVALLVNSNTLDEMIVVWRNICIVLLSVNQNDHFKISLSTLAKMADEMNADPDKTNYILRNVLVTAKGQVTSTLDEQANENDDDIDAGLGEEEAILKMNSSFKELFTESYHESKQAIKIYGNTEWQDLPANPLFSAGYLARLLKQYMLVAPIWSNLLLGNFAHRYGYSTNSVPVPCQCHFGRTTGVSESQMRVLKETILHRKVYTRVDEVISLMGDTIEALEIQFADHIFMKKHKNRVLPAKKQKPAGEGWNKGKRTKRTTGLYTSEKPPTNLVAMMNTGLLGQDNDTLLDAGQPTQHFRFENKENNSWFNSVCQMILSSRSLAETILRVGPVTADDPTSYAIMVTGNIFHIFLSKISYREGKDATVCAATILDQIHLLEWAGLKVSNRDTDRIYDFFLKGVIPALLHYQVDLQFPVNTVLECSSCGLASYISSQKWNFLLIQETGAEDTLDNVLADLFGKTLQDQKCPKCLSQKQHYNFLTIEHCPKHLFVRPHPTGTTKKIEFKLTPHIDISKVVSQDIVHTQSYSRYTLQSFITFRETKGGRHYMTYARQKDDWFCLDDLSVKVVTFSSIVQAQSDSLSIVFAHYTRPSETDVFSIALFNVLTNFTRPQLTLEPNLCLHNAVNYFVQKNIVADNPFTLVVVKCFNCTSCGKETYVVDKMHQVWQMKSTALHINDALANFVAKEITCSSCRKLGITYSVVYDVPKVLALKTRSTDPDCVNLIDEVDLLSVRISNRAVPIEYCVQTALIVLTEDQIVYLRKDGKNYLSHNKTTNKFEPIPNLTTQQAGLASTWTVFIYEVNTALFDYPGLEKVILDRSKLSFQPEAEVWSIGTVQDLLPKFSRPFKVYSIQLEQRHIEDLLVAKGDLNDLIINSHLKTTAATAPGVTRVFALDSLIVSDILRKDLKHIDVAWLRYDIILCPIQENNHWYIIILDLGRKLVIELDSLPTVAIARTRNITRLLHVLNVQHSLQHQSEINFKRDWRLAVPTDDKQLQQMDAHSCGIYLLVQARAYVNNQQFVNISPDKVRLYRYQLAEDILRKAELVLDDSDDSLPDLSMYNRKKRGRKQPQSQSQPQKQKHTTA